ncbi:hypothetical protein Q5H93_04850 [Hymenobacter sp. ASUV-10]|uniref:Uncharacterized protein n=1 Tax=Hymenobacter aranciens TaxID=3063996 RepID=A0ABT9B6Z9_9BACT|nr:hypothetical protein [Hymenobacter sp. ASUV-10]MDO7874051.1 hypothetical protein [Hymenobacter sp. ASUV-10]
MKHVYFWLAMLALPATAWAQSAPLLPPDSVAVQLHFGSDNPELHQLMSHVMHVEKLHLTAHHPRLAGHRFHLTYQEYRQGVPGPEQELLRDGGQLTSFDTQGRFGFDVFARQTPGNALENQFFFAGGSTKKTFQPVPGRADQYSLRADIWPYKPLQQALAPGQQPTETHTFPVRQKLPFLVYTLPYEEDGMLLYCSLAQSKTPVEQWFKTYKIPHFVVYRLVVEPGTASGTR